MVKDGLMSFILLTSMKVSLSLYKYVSGYSTGPLQLIAGVFEHEGLHEVAVRLTRRAYCSWSRQESEYLN